MVSDPESTADALAREFAALNKATERAHTAIADMRAARAELRAMIEDAKTMMAQMKVAPVERAEELVRDAIGSQLDQLVPDVQKALDQSVATVNAKFDSFSAILLGTDQPHPEGDLESQVREAVARKGPRRPGQPW